MRRLAGDIVASAKWQAAYSVAASSTVQLPPLLHKANLAELALAEIHRSAGRRLTNLAPTRAPYAPLARLNGAYTH